jgi:hypothetical protein
MVFSPSYAAHHPRRSTPSIDHNPPEQIQPSKEGTAPFSKKKRGRYLQDFPLFVSSLLLLCFLLYVHVYVYVTGCVSKEKKVKDKIGKG